MPLLRTCECWGLGKAGRLALVGAAMASLLQGSEVATARSQPLQGAASPSPAPVISPSAVESPTMVILPLAHLPCEQAAELVRPLLSPKGSAVADERLNRLFVHDVPSALARVRAFLAQADVAAPQVLLEVTFRGAGTTSSSPGFTLCPGPGRGAAVVLQPARSSTATGVDVMSLTAVSGAEAVIAIGDRVPQERWAWLHTYALGHALVARDVVWEAVETGFGVVPRVLGPDEIELAIYPRVAWTGGSGRGVVRMLDLATRVRVRPGQSVQVGAASGERDEVLRHLLGSSTRHEGVLQSIELSAQGVRE